MNFKDFITEAKGTEIDLGPLMYKIMWYGSLGNGEFDVDRDDTEYLLDYAEETGLNSTTVREQAAEMALELSQQIAKVVKGDKDVVFCAYDEEYYNRQGETDEVTGEHVHYNKEYKIYTKYAKQVAKLHPDFKVAKD